MTFTFSEAALWTDGLDVEWTLGVSPFLELDPVLTGGGPFSISLFDNQIDAFGSAGNTLELIDPAAAEAAIGSDNETELQFSFTRDGGTQVDSDITILVSVIFYDAGMSALFTFDSAGLTFPAGDTLPTSDEVQTVYGTRTDITPGVVDSAFFTVSILGALNVDDPALRFNIHSFKAGIFVVAEDFFRDLRGCTETP